MSLMLVGEERILSPLSHKNANDADSGGYASLSFIK
jgi:hypothetical protein